jgi:hypothetical protein
MNPPTKKPNRNRKTKMKIKIALNAKGRELSDSLDKINGNAKSSTASAMDILNATEVAEKQLAAFGIAKSSRIGAEMVYTSGGSVARAYKYTRIANRITAVRGGSFWYVTSIERVELFPNQSGEIKVGLNADQEKIALSQVRSKFYSIEK